MSHISTLDFALEAHPDEHHPHSLTMKFCRSHPWLGGMVQVWLASTSVRQLSNFKATCLKCFWCDLPSRRDSRRKVWRSTGLANDWARKQPVTNSPMSTSSLPSVSIVWKRATASVSSTPSILKRAVTSGLLKASVSSSTVIVPLSSVSHSAKNTLNSLTVSLFFFASVWRTMSRSICAISMASLTKIPAMMLSAASVMSATKKMNTRP